jgi:hypothetical protein
MSSGPFHGRMTWHWESSFPGSWVSARWGEELDIACVAHDAEDWLVVMHSGTGYTSQSWQTSSSFPKSVIKEKWDQDAYITHICAFVK